MNRRPNWTQAAGFALGFAGSHLIRWGLQIEGWRMAAFYFGLLLVVAGFYIYVHEA